MEIEKKIDSEGTIRYYKKGTGVLHCEDGPAVIYANGTQLWYRSGCRHRDDGPAAIYDDGTKMWFKNGYRHRDDGPAVIYHNGTQLWFKNGRRIYKEDDNIL